MAPAPLKMTVPEYVPGVSWELYPAHAVPADTVRMLALAFAHSHCELVFTLLERMLSAAGFPPVDSVTLTCDEVEPEPLVMVRRSGFGNCRV